MLFLFNLKLFNLKLYNLKLIYKKKTEFLLKMK